MTGQDSGACERWSGAIYCGYPDMQFMKKWCERHGKGCASITTTTGTARCKLPATTPASRANRDSTRRVDWRGGGAGADGYRGAGLADRVPQVARVLVDSAGRAGSHMRATGAGAEKPPGAFPLCARGHAGNRTLPRDLHITA